MIRLDAATVLLQWAAGGLLFLWVTTRGREVGIGYGWLVRGTYILMAAGALAVGLATGPVPVREVSAAAVVVASGVALVVSIVRRKAGVARDRERQARRSERVAAMVGAERTGIERRAPAPGPTVSEFPPVLDLVAPLVAVPGLVAAGIDAGDPAWLSVARVLVGAAFLGAISDGMLLGHWYLVQPGLARRPLLEMVRWTGLVWPAEVVLLLVPTGMVSVLNGTIDDGYNGMLGWFWVACAVTTIGLVIVTRAALKERYYSAVMAATGLLYLAILTAFGTDLVARALLAT
ncbi:MAG TPA: hypothetical protein VKA65_08035 [Acidimicrobiales bacterium]|nr:hypothetical protein [Acidimicrobiales bacterium]